MQKLLCALCAGMVAIFSAHPASAVRVRDNIVTGKIIQDYEAQLREADAAVREDPNDALAWLRRADIERKLEKFPAALNDYNRACKLNQTEPRIFIGRGIIHKYMGENELAIKDIEKAKRLAPSLAADLEGNEDTQTGGLRSSLTWLRRDNELVASEPRNPAAYIQRAGTQLDFNNWRAGVADLTKAMTLAENFTNYGTFNDPYMASLQLGYEKRPLKANLYVWRGTTYKFHGKFAEARADLENAVAIDPSNQYAYITLGQTCVLLGDRLAALKAFETAAHLDPTVSYELAQFYKDQEMKESAKNDSVQFGQPPHKCTVHSSDETIEKR